MVSMWPWLAVAAAGAVHGLNPATGWALAAARAPARAGLLRALAPIALGHLASVAMVAAAVPAALQLGVAFHPLLLQGVAAAWLLALGVRHWRARDAGRACAPWARTGVALWSFIAGTAHGAGWMLVPALASVCGADGAARQITASGSMALALAAVGVHLAAMFVTMALVAASARVGTRAARAWLRSRARREAPV
ncbi:hypothetical protein JJB11_13115 [Ramlibacter ginsenosidimutans]|uniref:Uncharacterized protein n=1 Tax=Ramlibacter ginsenosidimutans TaxID=502333 RepID=A0A934TTL8_9BURK|nr:hypothetical protein [Ramlibacter ginsenosidimutans]MBK6007035.1 hypothetical protein [Ramlibacter ginsenosidimutans]